MKLISILFIILFTGLNSHAQSFNLRCEHLQNPLGIDAPHPRLSWQIDDTVQGAAQTAYRIFAGTDPVAVKQGTGNIWDSGKIISDSIFVVYQGNRLQPFTKYYWAVKYWDQNQQEKPISQISSFETGMMGMDNWQGDWISDGMPVDYRPAPYFRKEINLGKKIVSARAYVAVAGLYELYINGEKVGDRFLDPMYTRFDRRTLYSTFDVTDYLQQGGNAIGILLGNGWYNLQSKAVWYFDKAPWRARPKFCMDIHMTFEDSTTEVISTNRSWKTHDSPLTYNSIYTGERYDDRLAIPGWCTAGFDDHDWKNATLTGTPSQNIVSQQFCPIRIIEEMQPATVNKIDSFTYMYSFPYNIAGITRLKVNGPAGTEISLKHGEKLYENGLVDFESIAKKMTTGTDDFPDPFQTDIYTLSGNGVETFQPHFNYKGFQYVEVRSSVPLELDKSALTALVVHSDVPKIGNVKTSNELLNKIFEATNDSYLNNLHGYPTDCPHREKNGWTGDAHIAIETALYGFDGVTIYEKWMNDHLDEQLPNGTLPCIIPTSGWGYHWANGTDWVSTIAIIPWQVYQFTGDKYLLEKTYDGLKKYVDLIERKSKDGLVNWALGDWSPIKTKSNTELISSLYFYLDAKILSGSARLQGREEDSARYAALAEKVKTAINSKFLDRETGIYADGSQTELSAPLFYKVVPEKMKARVVENLVKKVHESNDHLDVGLLGTKTLFNALSENGHTDLAVKLLAQDTPPSFGYYVANGATTLYEGWNPDKNKVPSLNHIMFGECAAWLYKGILGIFPDPESLGFKNVVLKPNFVESLDWAEGYHDSPYGRIELKWKREKGTIRCNVVIPANSTATISFPSGKAMKILESGKDILKNMYISAIEKGDVSAKYKLLSGSYSFTILQ